MSKTKAKIRAAATALFNAEGYAAVNTHHIAKRAGISPGNLYYHYPNKGEILRDLFDEIAVYSAAAWRDRGPANPAVDFARFLEFFFGSVEEHRFFFRDFPELIRRDPELGRRWRGRHARLTEVMRDAVRRWTKAGILEPMEDVDAFIDTSWILCHFAASYLEAKGSKEDGMRLLLAFLSPYHTETGKASLRSYAKMGA